MLSFIFSMVQPIGDAGKGLQLASSHDAGSSKLSTNCRPKSPDNSWLILVPAGSSAMEGLLSAAFMYTKASKS